MRICAEERTCVTVPGADSTVSVHMVWIESITTKAAAPALGQGGDDVLDIGLGGELDRRAGKAEPLGPQAHLRHRLFARDIDDAVAGGRQRRRGLHQQGRLADAGIAADQQHRARHQPAAGDAVELGRCRRWTRGASSEVPDRLSSANSRPLRPPRSVAGKVSPGAASSAMEFQAPQASHLPCQRMIARRRRSWQMKEAARLAMVDQQPERESTSDVLAPFCARTNRDQAPCTQRR